MSDLPELPGSGRPARKRSASLASIADDALLVGAVIVGAFLLLKVVGVITAAVWFVVKLALAAAVVYALVRAIRSRGR